MNKIKGKLFPLHNKILVSDMDFGMEVTAGGIILHSDDGKSAGIHPRWAKVFAIGPDQKDVTVGEWVLLEHGRWTRGIDYETESGEEIVIRMVDNNAVMMSADEKPAGTTQRATPVGAGSNVNFNIPGL
jgi:co-chaperonin GroES (HSP10)